MGHRGIGLEKFDEVLQSCDGGDRHADMQAAMTRVNQAYEAWIRQRPEQWFWMHRRWVDSIG